MRRRRASRVYTRSDNCMWISSKRYATKRVGMPSVPRDAAGVALAVDADADGFRCSMENFEIDWGLPLSVSWKSSMVRLSTGWCLASRTTTGTGMRLMPDRKVTADSLVVTSGNWAKREIAARYREMSGIWARRRMPLFYLFCVRGEGRRTYPSAEVPPVLRCGGACPVSARSEKGSQRKDCAEIRKISRVCGAVLKP